VLSKDKKRGNLSRHVHKAKRESPQKHGLPGKKKGDRENLSPVYGGAGGNWTPVHKSFSYSSTCVVVWFGSRLLRRAATRCARNQHP